uniref:tetratricopeptide repeat protein n=1 Tax=Candidatus Electronema sp. TaxID=2698783 RepID=UPI0040568F6E
MLLLHVEKLLRKERREAALVRRDIFFAVPPHLENNGPMRRESACAEDEEELAMNEASVWIEHLRHPLVLAGFGLFVFALIIKPLFLSSKQLNGTAVERLLHKAMILLFILAAMAVAGGLALSWKATPAAGSGISLSKEQFAAMLKAQQERVIQEIRAAGGDEQKLRLLEAQLQAVEAKRADIQKSYEEKLALLKTAEKALDELKGQLPDARIAEAKRRLAKGDTKAAEQIFDEVADKEGKAVALAAYQSGELAKGRLDYEKAMRQYKKAVTLEEDNPDYLLSAGEMAWKTGAYNDAQAWLEKLLKMREAKGENSTEFASSLDELAGLYYFQGRYAEAESLYKRSLTIYEQKLGKNHPSVSVTMNSIAMLYRVQGRYSEAEPLYKRALEIREQKLGKDHPAVAINLKNLAGLYQAQSRYSEAEPLYKRALEIREQKFGKDHPDVAQSLNNLAELYKAQGKYAEAKPLCQRSLSILKAKLPADHPHIKTTQENYDDLKQKLAGE